MKLNSQINIVEVWRGDQADHRFQTFEVPHRPQQTVLDIVTYIQRELDNTLSFRFSCRVGMCGTCAMTVNGVPRWTCRTQSSIFKNDKRIRIEPLNNFPTIKDLVVDMKPFFDRWINAGGTFQSKSPNKKDFHKIDPQSAHRQNANAAIECIGCGVCYAACDVVRWSDNYFGPAALNRVWSLVNDDRYSNPHQLLENNATNSGCLACHTMGSCTTFCPKELDPSASIASLKKEVLRASI